jgi:hypothetical protein
LHYSWLLILIFYLTLYNIGYDCESTIFVIVDLFKNYYQHFFSKTYICDSSWFVSKSRVINNAYVSVVIHTKLMLTNLPQWTLGNLNSFTLDQHLIKWCFSLFATFILQFIYNCSMETFLNKMLLVYSKKHLATWLVIMHIYIFITFIPMWS